MAKYRFTRLTASNDTEIRNVSLGNKRFYWTTGKLFHYKKKKPYVKPDFTIVPQKEKRRSIFHFRASSLNSGLHVVFAIILMLALLRVTSSHYQDMNFSPYDMLIAIAKRTSAYGGSLNYLKFP